MIIHALIRPFGVAVRCSGPASLQQVGHLAGEREEDLDGLRARLPVARFGPVQSKFQHIL